MDGLTSLAANGARILDAVQGDLTGDGRVGAVLVIDPYGVIQSRLGEGPDREVALVLPDAAGNPHKVASNARIVPCATRGGLAGDPYGYTRVARGGFTIVVGGGSREHWADEYTFAWSAPHGDWRVSRVRRKVSDGETGKEAQIDLSAEDLGDVWFRDFDPAMVPEVTLP